MTEVQRKVFKALDRMERKIRNIIAENEELKIEVEELKNQMPADDPCGDFMEEISS